MLVYVICFVNVIEYRMGILVIIAVVLQLFMETCTSGVLRFDRDGDIYAAVGQPLNVFCIINENYRGSIKSSDLDMYLKTMSSRQKVKLDSTAVRIVNETAIELHYRNVTGVKTVDLEYGRHRNTLYCSSSKIDVKDTVALFVSVGDLPDQPKITGYFVDNWNLVNFTWSYSDKQNSYNTTYAAWFRLNHTTYRACEKMFDRFCLVDIDDSEELLIVKVNASNIVGKSSTDDEHLHLNNRIRPGPVQNLTVVTNGSGNEAYISFSPPRANKLLEYKIQLKCDGLDETFEVVSNASVETRRVGDLPAYSYCNVSVGAKTTHPDMKLWGPFSTYQFITNENVPSSSPETCRACFELIPLNSSHSTIKIFMKPLPAHLANGKITQYYVKNCVGPDKNVSTASELNKIEIEIPTTVEACHIEFRAGTRMGYNLLIAPSVVDVSTELKPTQNSTVILSNDNVTLSWLRDFIAANYTVFWQKLGSGNEIYQNAVDWNRVKSGESHYVIPIPSNEAIYYRFGVGYETEDGYSNGIQWSKCLYSELSNAYAVDVKILNVTANSVSIHMTVDCSSSYLNGYAYAYNIYTCDEASSCSVKLVDSLQSERTVDNLRSDSEYRLYVQSLSSRGDNVQSEPKTFRTAPDNSWNPKLVVVACICVLLVGVIVIALVVRWSRQKVDVYTPYMGSNQPITTDGSSYGSIYLQRENPLFGTEEDRDTAALTSNEQQLSVQFRMARNFVESSSQRPCLAVPSDGLMNSAQSAYRGGAWCVAEPNINLLGNEPRQLSRWNSAEDDFISLSTQQLLVADSLPVSATPTLSADTFNVGDLIPGGDHLLETPILGRNTEVQCTADSHFVYPAKSAVGASSSTVHTASDSRQSSACSDDYSTAFKRTGNDHHTHRGANLPMIAPPTSVITATFEGQCSLPNTPTPAVEYDETARGVDIDSQQSVSSSVSSAISVGYAHCVARENSQQSRASTSNGNDNGVELLMPPEETAVVTGHPPNEHLLAILSALDNSDDDDDIINSVSSDCNVNVTSTSMAADGQSSAAAGAIDVSSGGSQTVAGDISSSGSGYCCAEFGEAKQAFQQPEGEPAGLHYDDDDD